MPMLYSLVRIYRSYMRFPHLDFHVDFSLDFIHAIYAIGGRCHSVLGGHHHGLRQASQLQFARYAKVHLDVCLKTKDAADVQHRFHVRYLG